MTISDGSLEIVVVLKKLDGGGPRIRFSPGEARRVAALLEKAANDIDFPALGVES